MSVHKRYQIIICGAGPVGLLAANLLGKIGVSVLVVERRQMVIAWSRAIGISPPSLDILASIGLDAEFVARGVPISQVGVHGAKGTNDCIGRVSFAAIASAYPYILSLPQIETEEILMRGLERWPSVTVWRGMELVGLAQNKTSIRVELRSNIDSGKSETILAESDYLLGCDGLNSSVRNLSGIAWHSKRYRDTFVMGDFIADPTAPNNFDFGNEAHLFFTPHGAVESFPLPGGKRRWIVQTSTFVEKPLPDLIQTAVYDRTKIVLAKESLVWQGPFGVQRSIAAQFRHIRIFLLGDAAHIMSPIGGQGMNTGFADAAALIPLIAQTADPTAIRSQLRRWEQQRRRAFRVAAGRAARSMKLGTVRGWVFSHIRNGVLWVMLNGPARSRVPIDYAMLSIPHPAAKKEM